ncbi:MAG: RidA family protein [Porticoccaceae bacterium]|nr:RidA family protein [Porticoccaceae bacterium]
MGNTKKIGKDFIMPNGKVAPLSAAYAAGGLLFMSGQLSFDSEGKLFTGDVATQTKLALENIERVLKEENLANENIIKVTVWLTDVADFAEFNEAYVAFFGEHRPARSTTRADLMLPGAKIEIEAIAAY